MPMIVFLKAVSIRAMLIIARRMMISMKNDERAQRSARKSCCININICDLTYANTE